MTGPALQQEELDFPTVRVGEPTQRSWNAFAAVAIDAAVNLTEDRRYHDIPLAQRLSAAAGAQRAFLNSLLDPMLGVVFDLRIIRRPGEHLLSQAILIRSIGRNPDEAATRADDLARTVLAGLPDHVLARLVTDADELSAVRSPFDEPLAEAAFITREETIAIPTRPDLRQRYRYLYSVVPFGQTIVDWSPLYQRLVAADEPIVVSVAIHPRPTSPELAHALSEYATVYGHLAQADQRGAASIPASRSLRLRRSRSTHRSYSPTTRSGSASGTSFCGR